MKSTSNRFTFKLLQTLFIITSFIVQSSFLSAQPIKAVVRSNGTFDIISNNISITNCYPALDRNLLRVINVKISSKGQTKTIKYSLEKGAIELKFGHQGEALTINTIVTGQTVIPEMISIFRDGEVSGVNKVYKSPAQIMGEGGIKDWPKNNNENLSCTSLTGLIADAGPTMVISTRDYKKYISYTNAYYSSKNGGKKLVEAVLNTEGVSTANLPTLYITEGTSAFEAMKTEAAEVARQMGVKNEKPQSYHWCSWYYAYYYLTDKMLSDFIQGFKKMSPPVNIKTFQIDAGYHPHVGDWLEPSEKFPKGLKPSITEILANGYKAGIWIGPYMVGNRSKLYADHPDWILRYKNGKPVIEMSFYGENRLWGAMDEEIYCLDTSNPEVMTYLRNVFREFKKMGITFFKTDFMLYGHESSNTVIRHTPGKTSSEYQREFFNMIREEIGQESFWLGCIAPFSPMIGYVDAMRVSADNHPTWGGGKNMFDESKGSQHINNVWWQNDPDAMILQERYSHLNDEETKSLALWMGMLGGVINTSELFYEIPKRRTELFRFLEPGEQKTDSYLPYLNTAEKTEVIVKNYKNNSWAVLFVNRNEESISGRFDVKTLTGRDSGYCYNWNESKADKIGLESILTIQLKPHESRLIYISAEDKSPEGMTLGGKRR